MKKALISAVVIGALALGFFFGKGSRPKHAIPRESSSASKAETTAAKPIARALPRNVEDEFRKLARHRDNAGAQVRLLQLAEQIEIGDIPKTLRRLEIGGALTELAPSVARLAHRWAAAFPDRATSLADGFSKQEWKNAVLAGALGGLAESNPDAAIAAAQQAPGPKLQLWRGILETLAEADPARAHSLAKSNLAPSDFQQINWDLLRAWSDRDAPAALAAAQAMPQRAERDQAIAEIIVALDPEAAWSALETTTNRLTRGYALPAFFARLAAENPSLALQKLEGLDPRDRAQATESFGMAWARSDAKAAFEWIQNFAHKDDLPSMRDHIFRAYAETNPDQMFELISKSTGPQRQQLLDAAIDAISGSNPEKATAYLNRLGEDEQRAAQVRFVAGLAASDPKAAAELLGKTSKADPYLYDSIGAQWASHDPARALEWAQALPPGAERTLAINAVLTGLATSNPALAAAAVEKLSGAESRSRAVNSVMLQWGQSDPDAAFAWAQGLTDPALKTQALRSLTSQFTERRPEEALRFAQSLPAGEDREQALHTAARLWTQQDPTAALAWVKSLKDNESLSAVAPAVIAGLAEKSPVTAANFVAGLPASPMQTEALRNVVFRWSASEPAAVSQWIDQFPEGSLRSEAARELVANWSQVDSEQAARWLEKLPPGGSKQAAIASYVENAYYTRPAQAAVWIDSIGDIAQRDKAAIQVYSRWHELDPPAAEKWITWFRSKP